MLATILVIAAALAVCVLLGSSLYALARTGVPVKHTPPEAIEAACRLAAFREGETVLELGTGNGRFGLHVLRRHPVAYVGWELSLPMVLVANLRLLLAGLARRGRVRWGDARTQDWSGADVVFFYLMPYNLAGVRDKLACEARPGARAISFAFPLPDWKADDTVTTGPRKDPVFLYRLDCHRPH